MKSDTLWIFTLILGGLLLTGGGVAVYTMTRGLRNNNPGNIEYDGTAWEGLANPPNDGVYCVFTDPVYGIRAMARTISNYIAVDGIASTVTAIVSRYAPPAANDTVSYIADVDNQLGLTPGNDAVNLATDLPSLVAAMIQHENGINPYSSATILQGINLT
jgi:hypothetical protein